MPDVSSLKSTRKGTPMRVAFLDLLYPVQATLKLYWLIKGPHLVSCLSGAEQTAVTYRTNTVDFS